MGNELIESQSPQTTQWDVIDALLIEAGHSGRISDVLVI